MGASRSDPRPGQALETDAALWREKFDEQAAAGDTAADLPVLINNAQAADELEPLAREIAGWPAGKKPAYNEIFRWLENNLFKMPKADQIALLNAVLDRLSIDEAPAADGGPSAKVSLLYFVRSIAKVKNEPGPADRIMDLTINDETVYMPLLRGVSLFELQSVIQSGEFALLARDGRFAASDGDLTPYVGVNTGEAFYDKREIVLMLKVPRWLIVPSTYDWGLADFGEDSLEIARRHKNFF